MLFVTIYKIKITCMKKNYFCLIFLFVISLVSCSDELRELESNKSITNLKSNMNEEEEEEGGGGSGSGGGSSWPDYFYVHRGDASKNLYYAYSNNGVNYLTGQVGLGAQSSEGPAGVIFNNKMFVYYRGNGSSNIFVAYKSSPTAIWGGNTWINNDSRTNKELSALVHDNKVFVGHMGESNGALYLNYSTNGTSFIQTQALSTGNNVRQFAMASDGDRIYLFWTKSTDVFLSRVSYTWSDDPTNPNSWETNIVTDIETPNNMDIRAINGLSATILNGKIHLVWAMEIDDQQPPAIPAPPTRYIQWGVLDNRGDGQLSIVKSYLTRETKRRPGITNDGINKLIISFTGNSTDRVNTIHIRSTDGVEIQNAGETGGEAKVGGVFSFKR